MAPLSRSLVLSLLYSVSYALPGQFSVRSTNASTNATAEDVLPPSQDPFYTAPPNFEAAAPGTVLRVRQAPGNLSTVVGNSSAAYNILYRTTNSRYLPDWAVTTLFVPSYSTGEELLSYQIPYDTADVDDSPSFALYQNPPSDIPTALGKGWYVNVPDYEGPLASFTAGVQSGHATIDSVRAVLSSGFGLANNASYALWGYSGGAIASEWAAELQVQYAPEMNFSGVAIGGLTPNISDTLVAAEGAVFAGLVPPGILGLASQHPDLMALILANLMPNGTYNATGFLAAKNYSLAQDEGVYAGQKFADYFIGGLALLQNPAALRALSTDGVMGVHGVPQMPLFVYKAIADEVNNITATDDLVNRYCTLDANILYQRNTKGEHVLEAGYADAMAFEWLTSIFDGTHGTKFGNQGCTIQQVTMNGTYSSIDSSYNITAYG